MENILESYLVRLGFQIDGAGLARFEGALRSTRRSVDSMVGVSGARLLGWQGAATGAFVGMGAALAGLVDKVAMADQNYRLFALRMFTTQAVGRELSITMKALGASLDQIVWDPELHARAMQLFKDQEEMTKALGPAFEKNMLDLRNLRFEFQRLGVILQYGSFAFVSDLFRKMFPQFSDFTRSFHGFNDWLIHNLPQEADKLAGKVVGIVWKIEGLGKHLYSTFEQIGTLFVHMVGTISGDKSLSGAKFNWDSLSKAISDAFKVLGTFLIGLIEIENKALHLTNAGVDLINGNFGGAKSELNAARKGFGNKAQSLALQGGTGAVVGGMVGGLPGAVVGGIAVPWVLHQLTPRGRAISYMQALQEVAQHKNASPAAYAAFIAHQAKAMGVSPSMAVAVASVESSLRQYGRGGKVLMSPVAGSHATGLFQLEPGTAAKLGVDPTNAVQNIAGGVAYLQKLMSKYGNERTALEHYYGSKDKAVNAAYASRVMAAQQAIVHIDTVNITVPPSMKNDKQIVHHIREAMKFNIQKNQAQAGGGPYQQ